MSDRPVLQNFPQVDHHQASGQLGAVYEDIHNTLRLPWVAFGIRVLSQFPNFVPRAWAALKPQISTLYAEQGADLVRSAAILPGPPPPDPTPQLLSSGWTPAMIEKLKATLDALNYGNPKYLILITAWNEAWLERDAGGRSGNVLQGQAAELLPYGLPPGVEKFHLIDPEAASERVQRVIRAIRDASLHHGPASDYRVLAAWPDYLEIAFEQALRPVASTLDYEATAWRIRKIAREHIRGFPGVGGVAMRDVADSLSPDQLAGVTGLLFTYTRFIADISIAIIRLRQAFDGAEAATANKFPVG